jgi:hypothetical protein
MSTVTTADPRSSAPPSQARTVARWLVSFAGYPLGGLLALTIVGSVDSLPTAAVGGLLTGLVLGAVQAWALRLRGRAALAWALATAAGLSLGLAAAASIVGFGTTLRDLQLQGLICGATIGVAQALLLWPQIGRRALAWPLWLAAVWAVGWTVTTLIGVAVGEQFTVFGSAGAVTVAALTAVLPLVLRTGDHGSAPDRGARATR